MGQNGRRMMGRPVAGAGLMVVATLIVPGADVATALEFVVTTTTDGVDANPGDGICSTEDGLCTLRAAIVESNALGGADTITVPAGTYTLTITGAGEDLGLTGDLDVIGDDHLMIAGAGPDLTVISAAGLGDRVLDDPGFTTFGDVTVSGVTIEDGAAPAGEDGGGLRFGGLGSLTVTNATFEANTATSGAGGGVSARGSGTLKVTDVRFVDNLADGGTQGSDGGGLLSAMPGNLQDVQFSGNRADGDGGGLHVIGAGSPLALDEIVVDGNSAGLTGGGLWLGEVTGTTLTATLSDSELRSNQAGFEGGGIEVAGGTVTIIRTNVTANDVPGNPGNGADGGISAVGATVTLRDSTVTDNTARLGGGVGLRNTNAVIDRTTISGNSGVEAPGAGLSIGNFDHSTTVANSTISGNHGPGVSAFSRGAVTVDHTTVTANASGIEWVFFGGAALRAHGSIITGGCSGPLVSDGYNFTDSPCFPSPGSGDQVGDAQLGPLADNGGPTFTHLPAETSPVIDAADPAACPPTDQRGVPRPAGAGCDIGAVERAAAVPQADLALTLDDAPDPVTVGSAITYTATATNHGPDPASGVTVTVRIPLTATFTSADPGCSHDAGFVTCIVGDLGAGVTRSVAFVGAASAAAGQLETSATLAAASPADPDQRNNDATASTTVVLPAVTVANASIVEGTSTTDATPVTVTATLSAPAGTPVSVGWVTVPGTATAGDDYLAASGTFTFSPGSTSQSAQVLIVADDVVEQDESFTVELSSPQGVAIADGTAVVTIDDDDLPALSIADATVTEADAGTTPAAFELSLDEPPVEPVTVDVATADGTATAGSDFVATVATASFAPGDQSETFTVQIVGDLVAEPTETFTVHVADVVGATLADGEATGTITDTDVAIAGFTIDDVSVVEGNGGFVNTVFKVRRGSGVGPASVRVATADGTASQPGDYLLRAATVRFPAGVTERTIPVPVRGDLLAESDETFTVGLSAPVGAAIDDGEGIGTILDDGDICTVVGTSAADVLVGGPGPDVLCGIGGDDELYGDGGEDTLLGGTGDDILWAGPGADRLTDEGGNDDLDGGDGDDELDAGPGSDVLHGGPGTDHLIGGLGADILSGDAGDDLLDGDLGGDPEDPAGSPDRLSGGDGDDTLHGQAGGDPSLDGGPGIDRIHGGAGDDRLTGGPEGGNLLVGGGGDSDRCTIGPPLGDTRDVSCERPAAGTVTVDPWWIT